MTEQKSKNFGVFFTVENNRKLNIWSRPFARVVRADSESAVQDYLFKKFRKRVNIISIVESNKQPTDIVKD